MKKRIKRIGCCLYLTITLGICLLPFLLMGVKSGSGGAERQEPSAWPELTKETGFNWSYLQEAGDYFSDRFAYRQELIAADASVRSAVFALSPVDDVIVGKNGWLYYTATLDDYQHRNPASDRMLFNMAHNVSLMQRYTESLGKTFLFTIAPNKNSLYGQNMPDHLRCQVNTESDTERLVPLLKAEAVNYVDLFTLFRERDEVLYYKRDSHWNEKGALLVYDALLDACGKPHCTYENKEAKAVFDYCGDLNLMLYPVGAEPEESVSYADSFTWQYSYGGNVEDALVQTVCENGSQNLLLYRDSFGNSLLPYMAEAFSQAVFSKQVPQRMTDLVTYEPDIVMLEKVERHLPTLGKVPPVMSGLVCFPEGERVAEESRTTVNLDKEGSYWKFTGVADSACLDADSPIYIELSDADKSAVYEAFCVSLEEDGVSSDYGYILYISEVMLEGEMCNVKVMTESGDQIVILQEKELHMTYEEE